MRKNQKLLLVSLILLTATFLRFYRLYQTAPFLGDQGRDLIEIRESLLRGKIPLRGPLSNLGVHAGPAYYYLLIPPLLLSNFHPIGPTLFITFLGVITSFLLYYFGINLFGSLPSFLVAMLYASSPLVIQRTRGIWNPVPLPFFILLILFSFFQIQEKKRLGWFLFLGLFLGIAIQLYPPAYFLFIPTLGWWLYLFWKKTKKKKRFNLLKWSIVGSFVLFLTLISFLIFQIQNQFIDLRNLLLVLWEKFFVTNQPQLRIDSSILGSFLALLEEQFRPLSLTPFAWLNLILATIIITLPFLWRKKTAFFWHLFLSLWLLGGILVLAFLPGDIPTHYASFIWPLPFLLLASFISSLSKFLSKRILFGLGIILILLNLKTYFATLLPVNDLSRAEMTANQIIRKANNQPFVLLLLSEKSPSDGHLRYFLNLKGANIKSTRDEKTELLFLVCTKSNCPSPEVIQKMEIVESECLPVCPPLEEQKTINLGNWHFLSKEDLFEGQIYLFQKTNQS